MLTSALAFAFLSGLIIEPVHAEPPSAEACKLYMELKSALVTEDLYRHAPNRSESDDISEKEAHQRAKKARKELTARVGEIDYTELSEKCGKAERKERVNTSTKKSDSDSLSKETSSESAAGREAEAGDLRSGK